MESFHQWLVIFSGATISLLGCLLYSSARDLRSKQVEIDEFKRKREKQHVEPHSSQAAAESEVKEEKKVLQDDSALNEDWQSKVAALKQRLTEKENILINLQSAAASVAAMQAQNNEISQRNQRLEDEINNLCNQLYTAEQRLNETAAQNKELFERQGELAAQVEKSKLQTVELTAENNGLRAEADTLSSKLAMSEKQIDELRAARSALEGFTKLNQQTTAQIETLQSEFGALKHRLGERDATIRELQSENEGLRSRNQGLQDELERRQNQLNTGEVQMQEAIRQQHAASDHCARLEAEITGLKQYIAESQLKARDIEMAQQQIAELESRERIYREQQERLETLIADMERDLEGGKNQRQALEDAHKSLREAERVCEELRDENRRLEEETSRWQERLKTHEETQNQVKLLEQRLEELRASQAEADYPSTAALSRLTSDAAKIFQSGVDSVEAASVSVALHDSLGHLPRDDSAGPAVAIDTGSEEKAAQPGTIVAKRNWRMGVAVSTVIVLLLAGAIASGFLGINFSMPIKSAAAPDANSDEYTAENSVKLRERSAPRVQGTFETIRSTAVYSARSGNSALVATIERGTKLNVVDSRNGWLEIRSKHGRPPGFIREETAVRIKD